MLLDDGRKNLTNLNVFKKTSSSNLRIKSAFKQLFEYKVSHFHAINDLYDRFLDESMKSP